MSTWWLVPKDKEGNNDSYWDEIEDRLPIPEYTDDCSVMIGPFDSQVELLDWASAHPLYHGYIVEEGEPLMVNGVEHPVPKVVRTPAEVEDHWNNGPRWTQDYLDKLPDGPVKQLLAVLIQEGGE